MEQLTLLNQVGFWLLAAMMIAGALGVVFHRSIVYSALLLLTAFLAIAGIFVLLNAPFIAAAQVLVYAVGLTIVLIFGVMLTGDQPITDPVGQERSKRYTVVPAILSAVLLGFLTWAILYPNLMTGEIRGLFTARMDMDMLNQLPGVQAILADGGASYIGQMLFSKYLVPFELASILLLLAMMGAILLSKKDYPEELGESELQLERLSVDVNEMGSEFPSPGGACSIAGANGSPVSVGSEDRSETHVQGVH